MICRCQSSPCMQLQANRHKLLSIFDSMKKVAVEEEAKQRVKEEGACRIIQVCGVCMCVLACVCVSHSLCGGGGGVSQVAQQQAIMSAIHLHTLKKLYGIHFQVMAAAMLTHSSSTRYSHLGAGGTQCSSCLKAMRSFLPC